MPSCFIADRVSHWHPCAVILLICFAACASAAEPIADATTASYERTFGALKMKFCWCPEGEFTMGSPVDESGRRADEGPVDVTLKGYWLGKYEVTQGQWQAVMSTTPWKGRKYVKEDPDCPAVYVSCEDAMSFCRKLTETERSAGRFPRDWKYTLPTEAQWEYGCRAGTRTRYSFGNDAGELHRYAWIRDSLLFEEDHAYEVGRKRPNRWKLHDMHGNVWEWCRDWYAEELPGGDNPEVTSRTTDRVSRGGGWSRSAQFCRSAYRVRETPGGRNPLLGFRVVVVPLRRQGP